MPAPYFFLRPLLAADRGWAAVDWRSSRPAACADLLERYGESGAAALARLLRIVVPVSPELIDDRAFVGTFGSGHAVFVLPAAASHDEALLDRCRSLRKEGRRVGVHLDRANLAGDMQAWAFDFVEVDAAFARQELLPADLAFLHQTGLRKIATSVGTYEMFAWLTLQGFEWCDSHFLIARNPQAGKEPDLSRLRLLKLLSLVQQDSDTRVLEEIFREEPKLSYSLLRLVNSVAVGARTKISNFSQAIAILGRRQLQRWLQLLIYANNLADGHAPNPLMQLAAARGRQMELLAAAIDPAPEIPNFVDNAFLTGLFSLLDVLVNMPMTEIVKELPMHDKVIEALTTPGSSGVLGQMLTALTASESGYFDAAEAALAELRIDPSTHTKAQVTALCWAARIAMQFHD
jgi:EAL and modified HD-GYP domain-containing signal transduction protein